MKETYTQSTSSVLLVRPRHFGYNAETAASNIFQHLPAQNPTNAALTEFDFLVSALASKDIQVVVMEDRDYPALPDAVFPNNWFSTHPGGTIVLYPMLSPMRREERRMDLAETILPNHGFKVERILDFISFEASGRFLEGTGSLVFDHQAKIAYACLSSRTDKDLVHAICDELNYETMCFEASYSGSEIYHTNVMLSIGSHFAVVCSSCITGTTMRKKISGLLEKNNRTVIDISIEQVRAFAGNILEVRNDKDIPFTIMSSSAARALEPEQREVIEQTTTILEVPIPVIESVGGGSVRCMMAEIFLGKG